MSISRRGYVRHQAQLGQRGIFGDGDLVILCQHVAFLTQVLVHSITRKGMVLELRNLTFRCHAGLRQDAVV